MKFWTHRAECTGVYGLTTYGHGYSENEAIRALLFHGQSNFNFDTLQVFRLVVDDIGKIEEEELADFAKPEVRREWIEGIADQLADEAATLRDSLLQPKGGQ